MINKKTLDVVLAQPGFRSGPIELENWYLPYTIGCLWAYASHDEEIQNHVNMVDFIWNRDKIENFVDSWSNVDILFCSVYIWSENYCSELSIAVKQKWPHSKIIWGGPQCDHSNPKIFEMKPYIDGFVVSEGEHTFKELCHNLINGISINNIDGCVFNQNGLPIKTTPRPRSNIADLPSPYLAGVFDEIIDKNPNVNWSAIIETNRGCPYSCTFCDWGSLTASKIKLRDLAKIEAEIEWFSNKKIKFLFIIDANFGIFKDRDIKIAKLIKEKNPQLEGLSLSFLKNKTESMIPIAKELKDLMHNGVSLSVQSLDPHTLDSIKRSNMQINDIAGIIEKLDQEGIGYYTELILGLPGESLRSWKQNIWTLYENKLHVGIMVYQLIAAVNTELYQQQKDEYDMKLVDVRLVADGNHIAEYAPTVISSSSMPYQDYIDAWLFTKEQNLLHCGGFSLDASITCFENGHSYDAFYSKLKEFLNTHQSWRNMLHKIETLFHEVFSKNNQETTERLIDRFAFRAVFDIRDTIFDSVDKTLYYFNIPNRNKIIRHAQALVYDPYNAEQWPKVIDGKTYSYVGRPVTSVDQYAEFQSYRRGSIFVKVS